MRFYVLHFPVTLIGLAIAAELSWSWPVEFVLLLVFVYGITWMLWCIVDRFGAAAYLVGGKPKMRGNADLAAHGT